MSGVAKTTLAAVSLFVIATPALSDGQPHQSGLLIDLFKIAVVAVLVVLFFVVLNQERKKE
jgi:hypothetical protein